MKVSTLWLKEFVDFDQSPEELAVFLRNLGFDTASITRFGGGIENVVTAKVETAGKHPNANKLSLCQVFDGKDRWTVVCGAPNVAAGQTVPLARVGAKLPGGINIEKAVIRGQESSGMICSAKELALGEDHGGIMVLPPETPLGEDINAVLALGDAVLDVEVTPNRPDVLSHWGVAREIAASLNRKIRLPNHEIPKTTEVSSLVEIRNPEFCPRYTGRTIENVEVRSSPLWMRLRLERCGVRPINNLVDITNYVLLEMGHPLHAFDRDKLQEGRVIVRLGGKEESLLCLDEVTRPVGEALVIADAKGPAAVAGVMGGEPTAVQESTKNILLESACFVPSNIRRTRTRLNMSTESSYRFERGTDWTMSDLAGRRAAHLFLTLAGGKLTGEQDAKAGSPKPVEIKVTASRINLFLGTELSVQQMKEALERLDFRCLAGDDSLLVTPPIHRQDVREDADVAEEVARLVGYDKVPQKRRASTQPPEPATIERRMLLSARQYFVGAGFYEARNYGLSSRDLWGKLAGSASAGAAVELGNPISLSGELLSPSLLVNLLVNLQGNVRRGNKDVRLFESARTFFQKEGKALEKTSLAWVASGCANPDHWKFKPRPLEIWDAKSWVKTLLKEWRIPGIRFVKPHEMSFLHPAEALHVFIGEKNVGFFGKIHPRRADAFDVPRETLLGELELSTLAQEPALPLKFEGVPRQPAVYRDFSLIFPDTVSWASVAHFLLRQSPWVENIELFDVFIDPALPPGHRSLAFRVTFRHPERTLTDAEVGEVQEKILKSLQTDFKAVMRKQD
ncbi:MAG: phenylalanine--tRNA ligase subunit beta [Elusimicrobia bacterium]|nr:phenylalanine--tRNA ligase subunit beta [Elusimicrobiota bacterium]